MVISIGQPVAVYGGLDNSLSEHAAVITFVHKAATFTMSGQVGIVNVRVFLDSHIADRVLRYLPVVRTRDEAVLLNSRGAGHIVFLEDQASDMAGEPHAPAQFLGVLNGGDLGAQGMVS
jgi:hypothetical protein